MAYLTSQKRNLIRKQVFIDNLDDGYRISDFFSGYDEYDKFLKETAEEYDSLKISKTHLLISKINSDVIGYMTLCTDTIKLSDEEKILYKMDGIRFSIPALKIGKLVIAKKYRGNGFNYGSFMIDIVSGFIVELNDMGIACRFITVDADIENNPTVPKFYYSNNFVDNTSKEYIKKNPKTKSMRLDVFAEDEMEEAVGE